MNYYNTEEDVEKFLIELKSEIEKGCKLIIQSRRNKPDKNKEFMADMDLDLEDVKNYLSQLIIDEYAWSTRDASPIGVGEDDYKIFAKNIKGKQVYIKLKFKRLKNKLIYTMSFHEAERPITHFPFR